MDEIGSLKERALKLLRIGYEESLNSPRNIASMWHCAPKLGLDPDNVEHRLEFDRLVRYLAGRGYISNKLDGFTFFTITEEGREEVEGENRNQTRVTNTYTQNIGGNAYNPMMGDLRNINISYSFDMRTVEAEIDRAEEEAKQSGAPDAEQVQELLTELREHLRSGEPIEMGWLARFRKVCQDNPYLSSPVISVLLNQAFGALTT